jgi:hypothetical protein
MRILPMVLAGAALLGGPLASAQTARTIVYALRANLDPATQVRRVPDSWLEGVQTHMLLAASRAPHLTGEELEALGYSYCVSRRPAERQ